MKELFPRTSFASVSGSAGPDLVFMDSMVIEGGLGLTSAYWTTRLVPHIILSPTCPRQESPPGWSTFSQRLSHHAMGGSTDGVHCVAIMVPGPLLWKDPHSALILCQLWMPLRGAIDLVMSARWSQQPLHTGPVNPCVYMD